MTTLILYPAWMKVQGAQYKVMDKQDGLACARKVLNTRDLTSIRQVVRELMIVAETRHKNNI